MSSVKLNDPLAPTYRRNYRTHLALEHDSGPCSPTDGSINAVSAYGDNDREGSGGGGGGRSRKAGGRRGSLARVGSDSLDGTTFDDEAPLLSASQSIVSDGSVAARTSSPTRGLVRRRDMLPPEDRYGLVRAAFFLFGIVSLLPWNFFITASEYWMYKFRDVSGGQPDSHNSTGPIGDLSKSGGRALTLLVDDPSKTRLGSEFFSALSIASNVPFLVMLYVAAILNEKVPARIRNPLALIAVTLLFASVTGLVVINTDTWQEWFYRLTLVQMLLVAGSAAIFQGGIMGIASTFPSEYAHACVVGQSAGGVLASVLQVAVLLLNVCATTSALIFFLLALALLVFSIVALFYTQRSSFYRFYAQHASGTSGRSRQPTVAVNSGAVDDGYASTFESHFEVKVRTGLVVRKLWHYCMALVLIYAVTIGVFPGVLVHVEASGSQGSVSALWARLFSPVACFLVFNVGDLLGRILASSRWSAFPAGREHLLLGLSAMRLLFLPLLFACNVQPRAKPAMPLPVVFDSDVAFMLLNSLLAFSNGYLTSAAMVLGPKRLDYFLQEKAGAVLVAMLATGMTTGSFSSLLFVRAFFHPAE